MISYHCFGQIVILILDAFFLLGSFQQTFTKPYPILHSTPKTTLNLGLTQCFIFRGKKDRLELQKFEYASAPKIKMYFGF